MFRWLGKLLTAFTGLFWSKADALDENVHVVKKTFDDAQSNSVNRIKEITNAVGSIIANKEMKLQKIKDMSKQCDQLEKVKSGAKSMAKNRMEELQAQGKSKEEIKSDPQYIKCSTGFQDASSTLVEKLERIKDEEERVESDTKIITKHTADLQRLKLSLERLHEEESEHIADLESNKALSAANNMLAGVATDTTDADLAGIRKKRREVAGRAKASEMLAGTEAQSNQDSFLEAAANAEASSEFDDLMDWDEEEPSESSREASKLPE